jgi:hypothetical protein
MLWCCRRDGQYNSSVQVPVASLMPDVDMSEMGEPLGAHPGLLQQAPAASGTVLGTSHLSKNSAMMPSPRSNVLDHVDVMHNAMSAHPPLARRSVEDELTHERLDNLEKELQIEKESSEAAMLALKKELELEKESSKAALSQVLSPSCLFTHALRTYANMMF